LPWLRLPRPETAIDASKQSPKVEDEKNATVSSLSSNGGLSWIELERALPLPFAEWAEAWYGGPKRIGLIIRSSDLGNALNDEELKVTGLKRGVYVLKIDGETVGAFNDGELAAGINLGLMKTPMSRQAMKVWRLRELRNDLQSCQ
jgi:hypothetical protein